MEKMTSSVVHVDVLEAGHSSQIIGGITDGKVKHHSTDTVELIAGRVDPPALEKGSSDNGNQAEQERDRDIAKADEQESSCGDGGQVKDELLTETEGSISNRIKYDASAGDHTQSGIIDESGIEIEPSDDEDLGDTSSFDAEKRNQLFAQGLICERKGKSERALKCYLACLNGLAQHTGFVLLPQCLRNIAEIYYQKQEYDKAIHFIQAEKLYYENALINTEEIQKKLEQLHTSREDCSKRWSKDVDEQTLETVRAVEYEHLARLCLDRKQTRLALEYAGKCTQLRQKLFGEQHPKTKESLDFFAAVYAEVGKQQYSESMESLARPDEFGQVPIFTDSDESGICTPADGTPVSILRNRKNSEQEREKEKKQVRFHESVIDNSTANLHQRDQNFSRVLLLLLLLISLSVTTLVSLWLYCQVIDAGLCRSVTMVVHDAYLSMRYKIYKYTSTKHVRFS